MRDQANQWGPFTDNQSNGAKIATAVSELEAYGNRRLILHQPVRIGRSRPIDPGFVRHSVERELGKSPIKADMTVKAVEPSDGFSQRPTHRRHLEDSHDHHPAAPLEFTIGHFHRRGLKTSPNPTKVCL